MSRCRVTLQRATNITLFGGDSELLTLDIDFQSDYRLRIEVPRFSTLRTGKPIMNESASNSNYFN